jgi:hypothetical protein
MSSLVTRGLGGGNINGGVGKCSRKFLCALYSRAEVGEVHVSELGLGRKGR